MPIDRGSWRARARAWIQRPWVAPFVGVVLTLPALAGGIALDDRLQRARAAGAFGRELAERLDLFTFIPGDPSRKAPLVDIGHDPWFAAPDLRVAFFRPIAALSAFLDYRLLDRWTWIMHLESLALYAALIAIVAAAYRRFLPPVVAALGALVFAIDDAHGMPVGWLANRNALFATIFGVAALLAHDRWRRDRWSTGALLAPLAFALSLLSGELGLAVIGYVAAYAITIDPAPPRRRIATLIPYAVIAVAWQITYRALGYGPRASGVYLDPIGDAREYLGELPGHVGALVLGQLALPPSDVYGLVPAATKLALIVAAVAVVAFVAWTIAPRWKTDPATRFFALGAAFSLPPITLTFPADRLLLFAGFGASAIVARVIAEPLDPRRWNDRALRVAWIGVHLMIAPLLLPISSVGAHTVDAWLQRLAAPVDAPPALAQQTLVLVNSPVVLVGSTWLFPDPPRTAPARLRGLSSSMGRVDVKREDARTVLVRSDPSTPSDPTIVIFRDAAHPVSTGDAFDVPGMRAEIVELGRDGKPSAIRYRFDVPCDDRSLRWVAWNGVSYVDFAPPAIGEAAAVGPS